MDALRKNLLASLQRAIDLRAGDEMDAQRGARVLRIALDADEAPDWKGDAVALMQPAPLGSRDGRWVADFRFDIASPAAAQGVPGASSRPLPVMVLAAAVFGYPQVREYAAALLAAIAAAIPTAGRVALALPGADHGLDEGACIEHVLLGFVDALATRPVLPALRELVLLESNDARRTLMADKLAELLGHDATPAGWVSTPLSWPMVYFPVAGNAPRVPAPFERRLTYKDTLTAFVAMPFKCEMRDVFQYGIQGPALRSKFKAERLDFEHFTGSIVDQIKDRIQGAHLVIADITGDNANVFLEIGYAWGKNRPTLLLSNKKAAATAVQRVPFDVAGHSRIDYESIGELDKKLTEKLRALYPELHKRAMGAD